LQAHGHGDDVAIVRASQADLLRLSGRLEQASLVCEDVLAMGLRDPVTEANVRKDLGEIALARTISTRRGVLRGGRSAGRGGGARAIVAHGGSARRAWRSAWATPTAAEHARQSADLFDDWATRPRLQARVNGGLRFAARPLSGTAHRPGRHGRGLPRGRYAVGRDRRDQAAPEHQRCRPGGIQPKRTCSRSSTSSLPKVADYWAERDSAYLVMTFV
jgi:hypothetical protein